MVYKKFSSTNNLDNKNKIVCILGKSATGKDMIVQILEKLYGLTSVVSYTDRPMRDSEINGKQHQFVTTDEILHIIETEDIIAKTYYNNGYYYCTTLKQVQEANLFVVNEEGYNMLVDRLGKENVLSVLVVADEDIRKIRLIKRDGMDKAKERIQHDKELFKGFKADITIENNSDDIIDLITIAMDLNTKIKEFYEGKFKYDEFNKFGFHNKDVEFQNQFNSVNK